MLSVPVFAHGIESASAGALSVAVIYGVVAVLSLLLLLTYVLFLQRRELFYPAAYETVLAVGSHDRQGNLSDFSQRNGLAEILAPGEDVLFASRTGEKLAARGTSYATGFVSAAAAVLLDARPDLKPEELRQLLCSTADSGILNLDAALAAVQK